MDCIFHVECSWPAQHNRVDRGEYERMHAARMIAEAIGKATADGRRYVVQRSTREFAGERFYAPATVHIASALIVLADEYDAQVGEYVYSEALHHWAHGEPSVGIVVDGIERRFARALTSFGGRTMALWQRVQ